MLNPFQPVKKIEVRRFSSLPAKFRRQRRTAWSDPNRAGVALDSFLEGPAFDRQGNLWCVDIPFGRIFKVTAKKKWELAAQYDGWPNGLKIHRERASRASTICIRRQRRLRASGELQRLVANAPSPNGVTLNSEDSQLFVAMTRSQQIWRLPLMAGGTPSKTGVAIQLSGGHAGPDGIEMDAEDGLVVCHLGVGVWPLYITAEMPVAGKKLFSMR